MKFLIVALKKLFTFVASFKLKLCRKDNKKSKCKKRERK